MTPGVSIITTCKGRLAHLKQTLPLMLAQQPHQAIVVDYDCPDRTAAWVTAEHPGASVAEVRPRPHFNLSEARNAGAATASGDLLFFIDADILVQPGLLNWIAQHWREGLYLRVEEPPRTGQGRSDRQYNGTVAVPRNAFEQIGGYDTAFHNWGSEDGDLYERLREAGHQCVRMPSRYFSSIPHDDDARVRFVPVKDLRTAEAVSRAYRRAKAHWPGWALLSTRQPGRTSPLTSRATSSHRAECPTTCCRIRAAHSASTSTGVSGCSAGSLQQ
jgi:glycosyltransferase involved in cell wall biosynthesis